MTLSDIDRYMGLPGGAWSQQENVEILDIWGYRSGSQFFWSQDLLIPLKIIVRGFPGGAVVESLPANAGDMGSSPGLGGSHVPRSSWAREPQLLSLRVWSLCPATREAATVRGPCTMMKSGPRLPQLEEALTQKRRPNTAQKKKKKKKLWPLRRFCLYGV